MGKLTSAWGRLSSGFWFLPALMTVGAVAVFFGAQYLDQVTPTSLANLPIVFSGSAVGRCADVHGEHRRFL